MALSPKPWRPTPYVYADEKELLAQAASLIGCLASDLANAVGQDAYNSSAKAIGKTGVGHLVEFYMGKPPNSSKSPDVPELGIEIKTIPFEPRGSDWGPKEPTSLTQIDYKVLAEEDWPRARVQDKLRRILWVPYAHNFNDKRLHFFLEPFIWSPDQEDWPVLESDYEKVRSYVRAGRAHELSERLSVVLGARRKGQAGSMRGQPASHLLAKTRAWAFKTNYTSLVMGRQQGRPTVSLIELAKRSRAKQDRAPESLASVETLDDALRFVLRRIREFEGRTTVQVAQKLGFQLERSKNRHSAAVRRVIGIPRRGSVVELDKLGVRLHILDVDPTTDRPFEHVPFPAMVLRTFAEEDWDDAQLAEHLDRIIFVPTYSRTGAVDEAHELGRAFHWEPTSKDWQIVEEEWRLLQGFVRDCRVAPVERGKQRRSPMPTAAKTRIIHMRPHSTKGHEPDRDPCGNPVTFQCFWLNQEFVQRILKAKQPH